MVVNMKKLYKFRFDCGRMGELSGLFVADEEDINNVIGETVYFGEVLGKHSEIYGELEEADFKVITDDQGFINKFEELDCETGYNPFNYIEDFEEDDEEDEEDD